MREVQTTPSDHVVSPYISDPLLHVRNGIADELNEYFAIRELGDETGIFSQLTADADDVGMGNPDSVHILMKGPPKPGRKRKKETIAVLRISDHSSRQKIFQKPTETLPMDDAITWTLGGEDMGLWIDAQDDILKMKYAVDNDVEFTLLADDARSKIRDGVAMVFKMLDEHFKNVNVDLKFDM